MTKEELRSISTHRALSPWDVLEAQRQCTWPGRGVGRSREGFSEEVMPELSLHG